jgi:hypothetical protein
LKIQTKIIPPPHVSLQQLQWLVLDCVLQLINIHGSERWPPIEAGGGERGWPLLSLSLFSRNLTPLKKAHGAKLLPDPGLGLSLKKKEMITIVITGLAGVQPLCAGVGVTGDIVVLYCCCCCRCSVAAAVDWNTLKVFMHSSEYVDGPDEIGSLLFIETPNNVFPTLR